MDWHPNLVPVIRQLMHVAEVTFGPKSGAAKREWVIATLTALTRTVDIPLLPPSLEEPIKALLVRAVIEALWTVLYRAAVQVEAKDLTPTA